MRNLRIILFLILSAFSGFAATNMVDNLWVPSNFRYSGGGPVLGEFLTTDGAGNATWSVVPGASGGNVFTNASNRFQTTANNYTNYFQNFIGIHSTAEALQFGTVGDANDPFGSFTRRAYIGYNSGGAYMDYGTYAGGGAAVSSIRLDSSDGSVTTTNATIGGNLVIGNNSANTITINSSTATTPNGLSFNAGQLNIRTTGNLSSSGKLSLGSDINPTSGILQLAGTWTNFHSYHDTGTYTRTSGNIQHFNIAPTINADGSAIATILRVAATFNAVSNMTNIQQINLASIQGTGTAGLTNLVITGRGINVGSAQGTGTIIFGSFYGQQINDPTFTSNIISNNFGLHIEQRTIGLTARANLVLGGVPTSGNWGMYNASSYSNYIAAPTFFGTLTAGNALTSMLAGTATLDFGSIAGNSEAQLPITVTGTVSGDAAMIGVPFVSAAAGGAFTCFTSNDTVYVRCSNPTLVAIDPASGSFSATTIRH